MTVDSNTTAPLARARPRRSASRGVGRHRRCSPADLRASENRPPAQALGDTNRRRSGVKTAGGRTVTADAHVGRAYGFASIELDTPEKDAEGRVNRVLRPERVSRLLRVGRHPWSRPRGARGGRRSTRPPSEPLDVVALVEDTHPMPPVG